MAEGAIGIGLDIGEAHVGALLDLKASIDGLSDYLCRLLERQKRYQDLGPIQVQLLANATSDANSNTLVLDLGGPAYGRRWEIRQLAIGGQNWSSTVAGTADLITSSSSPLDPRSIAGLSDHAASLPSNAFYSAGQVTLRNPEHLYAVIFTPTASTLYVANGAAFDLPDRPVMAEFTS